LIVWYRGLLGRTLSAASAGRRNFLPHNNPVERTVSTEIRFRIGSVEADIVDLVKQLCEPLFAVFDYATFGDEVYRQIVTNVVKGRAGWP